MAPHDSADEELRVTEADLVELLDEGLEREYQTAIARITNARSHLAAQGRNPAQEARPVPPPHDVATD